MIKTKICPGCNKKKNLWDVICDVFSPHLGLWKLCHKCRKIVIWHCRYLAEEKYKETKKYHIRRIGKYLEEKEEANNGKSE